MSRITAWVLALAGALSCVGCAVRDLPGTTSVLPPGTPPDGRVHVGLRPVVRFGPVSGSWQTPRGGAPGTTSPGRPRFDETGVSTSTEVGVTATVDAGRHRLEVSYARQVLGGSAHALSQDLVSQASSFPAGTGVTSDSSIDWMSAHYGYLFEVPLGSADRLQLWPEVGLRAVGQHHRLDGSNGARVSRHYTTTMPDLALDWSWRPRGTGTLRFSGRVAQTLTVSGSPITRNHVFEALARAHLDFSSRASLFVEGGWRGVDLRDDQPQVQNRLRLDYGPWVGLGGEIRF
jgi:hypothetical protein